MNTNQHQKTGGRAADYRQEGENLKLEERESQQPNPQSSSSPVLPPSASSSPSHEFSFTISLHSAPDDKAKSAPASFAIDLSPADDIFFHGHLLPLHLLSHLPSSPRSSTNSMDSFTIPIKEVWHNEEPNKDSTNCSSSSNNSSKNKLHEIGNGETSGRSKSKSFSLFGLTKWRKGYEIAEQEDKAKHKRKLGFDVSQVLKRYARVVRPLLFFRGRKESMEIRRQAYSFSGNLSLRNKKELRGRRGEFSAPASMRTSPTNSGLLVATPPLSSSTSDSTMEELQSAIQAAIAHCKNSIAKEDKTTVKS